MRRGPVVASRGTVERGAQAGMPHRCARGGVQGGGGVGERWHVSGVPRAPVRVRSVEPARQQACKNQISCWRTESLGKLVWDDSS